MSLTNFFQQHITKSTNTNTNNHKNDSKHQTKIKEYCQFCQTWIAIDTFNNLCEYCINARIGTPDCIICNKKISWNEYKKSKNELHNI